MATEEEWVERAVEALTQLAEDELAFVWPEAEARIAEMVYPGLDHGMSINVNHLTTAKRHLLEAGYLLESDATTRGGRPITVYSPGDDTGRTRAIQDAAKRKRLLYGRYLGWAMGTESRAAIVGHHGEDVVHASLVMAAQFGYRLLPRTGHDLPRVFGEEVPGGPLDDGASLHTYTDDDVLDQAATVLAEVKNIREWIFPTGSELHQLLYKAAAIQQAFPGRPLLPVLICRRAHKSTFAMAGQLGFLVYDVHRQYIKPSSVLDRESGDRAKLQEVRHELGFLDLVAHEGHDESLVRWLSKAPQKALRSDPPFPQRWLELGALFVDDYRALRAAQGGTSQAIAGRELRENIASVTGKRIRW